MAGALLASVAFWLYTERVWEDALITIQHARSAVHGLGLTHHPDEGRVHGFTSALSVLLPLLGEPFGQGILVMRLCSLGAAAVTLYFAARIGQALRLTLAPLSFLLCYLAFDRSQIFYGMSGMESQVAVGILFASIYYVLIDDFLKSGVTFGLALLARPDFILWVIPAAITMLLRNRRLGMRSQLIALGIVAPWLLFTTVYYGSPMPHTILAKRAAYTQLPALSVHLPCNCGPICREQDLFSRKPSEFDFWRSVDGHHR